MTEAIVLSKSKKIDEKSCHNCRFCQAFVSWWCVNKEAIELKKTKIPDGAGCEFWKKMRSIDDLTWVEKTFKNFIYV